MKKETQLLFNTLDLLEDIRELLRITSPFHKLSKEEKKELETKLEKIKNNCDKLGSELL